MSMSMVMVMDCGRKHQALHQVSTLYIIVLLEKGLEAPCL